MSSQDVVPKIAIIGAGPAGLYTADGLARKLPEARIDVLDRLFTPFGLVRYGVAPDHQGTKAVTRLLDRLLSKGNPRFLGGVEIGRDLPLAALRQRYHAVVLATGCPIDRRLGIPGEDLPGVHGSGAFSRWYNAHPDHAEDVVDLALARHVAVLGNGNVAIDVARLLARSAEELTASDVADPARAAFAGCPVDTITIIGRRGPMEAGFTNAELAELGRLPRASVFVDPADLPAEAGNWPAAELRVKQANLETFRSFAGGGAKPITIRFLFHRTPLAFEGEGRLQAIRLRRPDGGEEGLPADLAVTCIGYRAAPLADAPFDTARGVVAHDGGRVAPGLYAVGWAKRGPSGVIPTNRSDGLALADTIAADLPALPAPGEADDVVSLLAARGIHAVTYADWKRHDAAEIAAASPGAPRRKSPRLLP